MFGFCGIIIDLSSILYVFGNNTVLFKDNRFIYLNITSMNNKAKYTPTINTNPNIISDIIPDFCPELND
jgi:hypothetical protein